MEIEIATAGVSNFREFQSEARDFFSRSDERAKTEKAFHEKRDKEIKDALQEQQDTVKLALDKDNTKTAKRSVVWQIAGVFVSAAAVCVAILAIVITVYVVRRSALDPPELLRHIQSRQTDIAHVDHTQLSGIQLH